MSFIKKPVESFTHWATNTKKRVYMLNEGSGNDKELLGLKGADLCEMTRLGLPVPNGCIITTETCLDYFRINHTESEIDYFIEDKKSPDHLEESYLAAIHKIEIETGKKFGACVEDGKAPLLLAIRAGAAYRIPGMDTVLNVGINDHIVELIIQRSDGYQRFALDIYRRFLQMFGHIVMKVDNKEYTRILQDALERDNVQSDEYLSRETLRYLIDEYKKLAPIPQDPYVQLRMTIEAIFCSWNTKRAKRFRQRMHIPENLGTAVIIQAMVYGSHNSLSGTGIAYSRNPETGENTVYGEYLSRAGGDDIILGPHLPKPLEVLEVHLGTEYTALHEYLKTLERSYKDAQVIEFTIDNGKLYILETKNAKRSPKAAVRIATEMVKDGIITQREALMKIEPHQMNFFLYPRIDPVHAINADDIIGTASNSSGGVASGKAVFSVDEARDYQTAGISTILILQEATADDIEGLKHTTGVLTIFGGKTSHIAEEARSLHIPAVTNAQICKLSVSEDGNKKCVKIGNQICIHKDEVITIDGSSGRIIRGSVSTIQEGVDENYETLMKWAVNYKRMAVFSQASSPDEATKGLELGADGLGMYRLEKLLLSPENKDALLGALLTETNRDKRRKHLDHLQLAIEDELMTLFHLYAGKIATIRLIDFEMNQLLPQKTREVDELAERLHLDPAECRFRVTGLLESNSLLGVRGCRLGIMFPDLFKMQIRALINAAVDSKLKERELSFLQIFVPMVSTDHEMEEISPIITAVADEVFQTRGNKVKYSIGCGLDTPRACLRAQAIASEDSVDFLCFDTDLLTQLVYGLSRTDTSNLIDTYRQIGVMKSDPFEVVDERGVGSLMLTAKSLVKRSDKKDLMLGINGRHTLNTRSIHFFDEIGIDFITCSPLWIPTAVLAAAQAHIQALQK